MSYEGIRSLPEMAYYIKNFHSDNLFDFDKRRKPYSVIVDKELQFIDQLLDNQISNSFIAPDGYSAPHREIQPYQLFRMELLKIIKYLKSVTGNFAVPLMMNQNGRYIQIRKAFFEFVLQFYPFKK